LEAKRRPGDDEEVEKSMERKERSARDERDELTSRRLTREKDHQEVQITPAPRNLEPREGERPAEAILLTELLVLILQNNITRIHLRLNSRYPCRG